MYDFLVQIILIISLSVIIYLFARALPRLTEVADKKANVLDRVIGKLPLEKMDSAFASFSERFLRKAKILVMKADHLINGYINKIKMHEGEREKRADLQEKIQELVKDTNEEKAEKEETKNTE